MRLLLRHLVQSIKKKPTQPLIITLTLALSVTMTIFAFTIYGSLTADAELAQAAKYGSADFTVELGGSSDSRFLFASDVRESIGDRANAVGIYQLPLILDGTGDTVNGVATELNSVNDLFSVDFVEYGNVTDSTLSEIAFVSNDFAEQRGISLGDVIYVETMGHKMNYRVEGISDSSFIEIYDVMVDIGSVMRAFADESLLFAALGENFKPCNTVYVDLLDGSSSIGEVIDSLTSDQRFAEMRFVDVRDAGNMDAYTTYLEVTIGVVVALTMLLAGVVTFCCFFMLANQRQEENFSLSCCGAGPRILGIMQYTEVVIYCLIGAPLGALISIPTVQSISGIIGLSYAKPEVSPSIAAISALIMLAVCILTVSLFLAFSKRAFRKGERKHRAKLGAPLLLLCLIAVTLGLMYTVPTKISFAFYCIQLAVLIVFVFFAVSPFLQKFALLIDRVTRGSHSERTIAFRYAVKNVSSLKILHNISILCALATLTAITVAFLITCFTAELQAYSSIVQADFTVYNATDRCYEKIESCDEVDTASKFYMNLTDGFIVLSSKDTAMYSPILDISEPPIGNEIVINKGLSEKFDVQVGDAFDLEIDGVKHSFCVSDIAETCIGVVVINCDDMNIPYNSILVKGSDDVSRADLLSSLSEATATELAPIQATETLLDKPVNTINTYIRAALVLLCVLSLFFVIGTFDALYECMRARGDDYGLYCLAGSIVLDLYTDGGLHLSGTADNVKAGTLEAEACFRVFLSSAACVLNAVTLYKEAVAVRQQTVVFIRRIIAIHRIRRELSGTHIDIVHNDIPTHPMEGRTNGADDIAVAESIVKSKGNCYKFSSIQSLRRSKPGSCNGIVR